MSNSASKRSWDKVSFILHFAFALTIVFQLFISFFMHRPYLGRILPAYQANAFRLHSYVGLLATGFVLLYWFWIIGFRRDALRHLFPWYRAGFRKVIQDLFSLLFFRLPEDHFGGLAGLIHGLGILLVTIVGIVGSVLFFILPDTKSMPPIADYFKETHAYLAYWVWWYLSGHSLMALVHWIHNRFWRD